MESPPPKQIKLLLLFYRLSRATDKLWSLTQIYFVRTLTSSLNQQTLL